MNDESRLLANVSIHPGVPAAGHIKFSLDSRGNAELVPKVNIELHATRAALPILTLKFPPKRQHSKSYHNFTIQQLEQPFKHKIQNSHQMLNLLHVYQMKQFTLHHPLGPNALPCPHPVFLFQKDEQALPL